MDKKIVEIPIEEFQELIDNLENCKKDKEKLIKTVEYLNQEINEYNKKYAISSQQENK